MSVHVKLVDKQGNVVAEEPNYNSETLQLPRVINHNELIFRFDSSEGNTKIYKQAEK